MEQSGPRGAEERSEMDAPNSLGEEGAEESKGGLWEQKTPTDTEATPRESQPAFTFQKVIGGKEVEGKTDGLIFLDVVRSHDNMRQALEEEPSIPSSSMVTTTVNPD